MMELLYPIILVASAILGLVFIRLLKGGMLSFGIGGTDINKEKKPRIPEAGGMLLLPGIWILVISLVQLELINPMSYIFLFTITCFAAIGFFDDGFRLFKNETGWVRYVANRGIVLFLFTIPFTYLMLPCVILCPLADLYLYMLVAGGFMIITASLANSFAGLNGWEVGSSMIILASLTFMVAFSQIYTSTLVALSVIMLGASIALFYFNRFPAKIFPGDSGTLLMGSFMGCLILFIDQWYIALGLFAPHVYDLLLKLRTNPSDMSQKRERPYVLKDGKLHIPESGKLDFAKALIKYKGPMSESKVSRSILMIVVANTLFWSFLYILLKVI